VGSWEAAKQHQGMSRYAPSTTVSSSVSTNSYATRLPPFPAATVETREFVVQTHPPLGIHICTRSQEDADGLGMALHRKQR